MTDTLALFKQDYHVGLTEVDFTRHLRLSALFDYFQDIANLAAEALGVGMARVEQDFGVAWILVRIRVDVIRHPAWNEDLTIETWPQAPGKVEFERDYLVRDNQGAVVAKAVSTWVIMDIGQRRLRRTSLIPIDLPPIMKTRAIDCQLGKLQPPGELTEVYKRVIGYSDIDLNGHLNNSKYVDFIMDCFSVESHQQHQVKSLEVSFVNEALAGDTLVLCQEAKPQSMQMRYIEGICQHNQQVIFRAQLVIAEQP